MNLVILDDAEAELSAAVERYEQDREGLGAELLAEADDALRAIAESPGAWPLASGSGVVRRFVFVRFPYVAYFVVRHDHILILAFGHTSRRPGYWRRRLRS